MKHVSNIDTWTEIARENIGWLGCAMPWIWERNMPFAITGILCIHGCLHEMEWVRAGQTGKNQYWITVKHHQPVD